MNEAIIGITAENKVAHVGKAILFDQIENPAGIRPMKTTWRQREAHRDGPDLWSLILHRGIDFPIYAALKYFKYERVQVAKYKSITKNRGLPDTRPLIVWKADPSPSLVSQATEKNWKVRSAYAAF